jgi:PAS domain S-box-containing protein
MSTSVSERERLAALASYDILDTPTEAPFDRIARLMAGYFDVPTATVAFVDADRTWVKATTGFDTTTSREHSFCLHVVTNNEPLVVEDARRDPQFADNPLVTGEPGVRFYAGAPLRVDEGVPVGTVCLYDTDPRSFSSAATDRLTDFAALVVDALDLHYTATAAPPDPPPERAAKSPTEDVETTPPASAFEAAARLTSNGLLHVNPEGRIEWVNDRFVELTGYTRQELHGRRPGQLLHGPATDADTVEYIQQQIDREEPFSADILNYRKSGAQYWVRVEAEPLFADDGTCTGFLVAETDITEERQREDAIAALTSFYEQALTELPIEVAVIDPEGHYLFINPAAVGDDEMREWLIGKTGVDYARRRGLDPAPFRKRRDWIRTVAETQDPDSFEETVTPPDGDTRHILRVAHPITDESGETVRVFSYGLDLTERKERMQKLVEAKERAEEMNRLKSAFLANMSHEIRTPLTSIIGFAEVLGEEIEGRKGEMASLIHRSGMRLKQTLTSVLDLARLEEDEVSLSLDRTDLTEPIRETVNLLRPQVEDNDLDLRLNLPNAPVTAVVDEAAFDRVLTNLVTNAIKFTEEGRVTVALRATPETAELTVADTGVGISESFLQRIFGAFEQESEGKMREYEGIGLGLTITKRLIDLMNGTIDVDSTKGEGTTVAVALPRFEEEAPSPPSTAE